MEQGKILRKVAKLWGRHVLHIWNRGFAGATWTSLALDHRLRSIPRWNNNYHLIGPDEQKHETWKVVFGKRSRKYRMLWDVRLKLLLIASLAYTFLLSLCLAWTSYSISSHAIVIEQESGAKIISQLHSIVFALLFLAFASTLISG